MSDNATTTAVTLADQLANREISNEEFVELAGMLPEDELRLLVELILERLCNR